MAFGITGFGMIAANAYLMNKYTSSSQNAEEIKSATTTVTVINLLLTLILGAFAYMTMSNDPSFGRGYIMFMIHMSLLLSMIALSVGVLSKV